MTEEDVDLTLAAWARNYAAGKSLPDGFSKRLRLSVRHSRRMFRLKLTAIIDEPEWRAIDQEQRIVELPFMIQLDKLDINQ